MNFNFLEWFIFLFLLIYIFYNSNNYFTVFLIFIFIISFLSFNDYFNWTYFFFSYNSWEFIFNFLLIISFIVVVYNTKDLRGEILFLLLFVLAGALIILYSNNLVMVYLGLEFQTFSLFILIGKNKLNIKSSEASLKYFILSALSSGCYLLGITFLFYNNLNLNINDLYYNLSVLSNSAILFHILIFLSLSFKLALFPLHFWIPDIYEGSSWEILALLATVPKISILSLIIKLNLFSEFYIFIGLLSVIIGVLGALNQTKLKRFLAYSGISHIGFVIISLGYMSEAGCEISLIYLVIYVLTFLSFFLLVLSSGLGKDYYLVELNNFSKLISFTWIMIILSMGGIPPLSGFISKWVVLLVGFSQEYYLLILLLVLLSIIGASYYLRIVKFIYMQTLSSYFIWNFILNRNKILNNQSYILGIGLYFTLFLILHPIPMFLFISSNISYLI